MQLKRLSRKYFPRINYNFFHRRLSIFYLLIRIILILILVVIIAIFIFNFFKIKKINNKSQYQINHLEKYIDTNILLIDRHDLENQIVTDNSHLESVSIEKIYPNTLNIIAKKEIPAGYLVVGGGYYQISKTGKVLEKLKKLTDSSLNLPIINFYQKYNYYQYNIGEKIINHDILASVEILLFFKKYKLSTKTIDIASSDMILLHSGGISYIFSTKKDIRTQLNVLIYIYKKIKQENLSVKRIDLRFDKPILTY